MNIKYSYLKIRILHTLQKDIHDPWWHVGSVLEFQYTKSTKIIVIKCCEYICDKDYWYILWNKLVIKMINMCL